jgi:predicted 2-oxoglutarate/Fe(II)-dependent dioxygenase YbiX
MPHRFLTHTATLIAAVRREGRFATGGVVAFRTPMLSVTGVGEIGFPVAQAQIDALATVAAEAPFGRGAATVHDRSVRSTLQIDASRIAIAGAGWQRMLDEVVGRVRDGLGIAGGLRADLYKLLIYRPGDFFKPHRDSEKAPGMVATLVLALPTRSTGGRLIVRHGGEEAGFDIGGDDPSETGFAAFYADCLHEVLPVTAGHRLVLTWNLIRDDAETATAAPDHAAETAALAAHLAAWPGDAPPKIAIPLEHAYTPAELGLARLKGLDRARAEVLVAAGARAGVVVGTALVTATETGWAEYADRPRWRQRDHDDEDEALFEIGEADDVWLELSAWDGGPAGPTLPDAFPLMREEIAAPDFLDRLEEGSVTFHEATGNEGVSYERTYAHAALVLWPEARTADVLLAAGRGALAAEIDARCVPGSDHARLAALLDRVAAIWPVPDRYEPDERSPRLLPAALRGLGAAGDGVLTERLLRAVAAHADFVARDAADLVTALQRVGTGGRDGTLAALVQGAIRDRPEAVASLLARVADVPGLVAPVTLADAVEGLVGLLDNAPSDQAACRLSKPEALADLLAAAAAVSPVAVDTACRALLAAPKTFHPDRVLLPLARRLASGPSGVPDPLREMLLAFLAVRIGEPLAPPPDWTRSAALRCTCTDCTAFSAFLAAPDQAEFVFKAAQDRRTHVEQIGRAARADADYATIRVGSPHKLVIRKTDASYRRRVAQRQQDLADRTLLGGESALPGS